MQAWKPILNPAEPQRMRLELRLALKPNDAMEVLERWVDLTGAPPKDDLANAADDAHRPSGHGVSTRRTLDWRLHRCL